MGQAGPLRWRAGQGWLILLGGSAVKQDTRLYRAAIEAMADEAPAVYVPAASAESDGGYAAGQRLLAQIEGLDGPTGYVAPILSHTEATDLKNARRLAQAGLIILGDGQASRLATVLNNTPAFDALAAAYEAGAVILAEGAAAGVLGAWEMSGAQPGWGWLPGAIVCPHLTDADTLHQAIKQRPQYLGLGLPDATALLLGPENQVQMLSNTSKQVTVVLGARFQQ